MRKIICVLISFCMLFSFSACSSGGEAESPESTTENSFNTVPILGVEIEDEENIGFYALTRDGTYSWTITDASGKEEHVQVDGLFCLDDEKLCTFTREQTGGKITLKFSGSVINYKIYQAPCEEIESDRLKIFDDKYLISTSSKTITFPENGEYYYIVSVNYTQGEVSYGFLLT